MEGGLGDCSAWQVILGSMAKTLSVVLITLNEVANLPRTLKSVAWAHEIVVVDSGSTDGTVEAARKAGARVFEEPWKGFAGQKNSAIAHATADWVLSLDADEEVSAELAREIQDLLKGEPALIAYRVPRLNHFLGRALKHGGYWPDPKLRLFRRGSARFAQRPVHETMELIGENHGAVGQLRGHLIHHNYATLDEYIEHMNRYSSAGARMLVDEGRGGGGPVALVWNAVVNPAATFVYNYIFRLGFLDGREGLIQHLNHSVYVHWKFVKAWQAAKGSRS